MVEHNLAVDRRHRSGASFINFLIGVNQVKNALCARQRRLRLRVQRADGLQRAEQVLHIRNKRHHHAHADGTLDRQITAQPRHDGDRHRAQHIHQRRKRAGEGVGLDVGVAVGRVALGKALLVGPGAVVGLRHAHTLNFLLQIRRDIANGFARFAVTGAGQLAKRPRHQKHRRDGERADKSQQRALNKHADQNTNQPKDAAQNLGKPVAHKLVDRLGVIHETAH